MSMIMRPISADLQESISTETDISPQVKRSSQEGTILQTNAGTTLQVDIIPATKRSVQGGDQFGKQKALRVAAYCRVSTGDESQKTSYTNQRAFYSGLIQSRPGWSFVGIYADEARSGTNRIHRREFNRMIEDAKAGKIDYIMTKSISRFARNTVDTLDCVRELRQLSPPVGIVFEKENIDTLNAAGELILTILSALAQDESRSLSDNIRWTFQKNFQSGKPQINLARMIGYDKGENGEWVINEKQAEIVRFIFKKYVCGHSARSVAGMANEAGMRTVNGKLWRADSVLVVLRNEKYVGDLEMQKTITKDFLTHKVCVNRGEAPKYYVKNHHRAIIDRFTWNKAQLMLRKGKAEWEEGEWGEESIGRGESAEKGERRDGTEKEEHAAKRGAAKSPFANLICGAENVGIGNAGIENTRIESVGGGRRVHECGSGFARMTYSGKAVGYCDERSTGFDARTETESYSFQYPVWRCRRKLGERSAATGREKKMVPQRNCLSTVIQECALEQSFMEMLYALKRDYIAKGEQSYLTVEFRKICDAVRGRLDTYGSSGPRLELLDSQIRELEQKLQKISSGQAGGDKMGSAGRLAEMKRSSGFASDLREQLESCRRERAIMELERDPAAAMKRNYEFFCQCLVKLPEENDAGMRLNVNGLDVDGNVLQDRAISVPRDKDGEAGEEIGQAPDYLRFERGIYAAFIKCGRVRGDVVEYTTNFGVRMMSTGNSRTLSSFLGYRKCCGDGTVELLDEIWKVNGKKISYRRKGRNKTGKPLSPLGK